MRTSGVVASDHNAIVIDFTHEEDVVLDLNGNTLRAATPAGLAHALRSRRAVEATQLLSIPFDVGIEGRRLVLEQDSSIPIGTDLTLTGAAAQAAIDKASFVAASSVHAWPAGRDEASDFELDNLASESRWDGPLIVSMPRTGSTLMGILFLFCRDPQASSGFRFDRYMHEPVAPVFWRGDDIASVAGFMTPPLTPRDVVQESAYQFADPAMARWFLGQAKPPVVFTMRHPQLSWPSRWRSMLSQMLDENPAHPMADRARAALASGDFSRLGGYLDESVRPADNGFYSFMAMIDMCLRDGIEFIIVDNTRFRTHPEATMRQLCMRLDLDFDEGITAWTDLEAVLPRVVMSDLALGDEFPWYYERTLLSGSGIEPETRPLLNGASFPEQLRGPSDDRLTIDEAVTWYQLLLSRPETLL